MNKKRLEFIAYMLLIYLIPFVFNWIGNWLGLEQRFKFNYSGSFLFFVIVLVFFFARFKDKLEEAKPEKERIVYLFLGVLFFLMYFLIMYVYRMNVSLAAYVAVAYLLYAMGFGSLFVFIVGTRFVRKYWRTLAAIFLFVLLFFQLGLYLRERWWYFASTIVKGSSLFLGTIGESSYALEGIDPGLSFEGFSVRIGAPCSGIDSLSMFFVIFFLIVVLDWKRFRIEKRKQLWWVFLLGMIGMFIVSIMRVVILMMVGARFSEELALGMFHTNAGWILFVAYVLLFWNSVYGWLRR